MLLPGVFNATMTSEQAIEIKHDITKFEESEPPVQRRVPEQISLPSDYIPASIDNKMHDIKSFFARPVRCSTVLWNITQPQNTQVAAMSMPNTCLLISSLWNEKLRGYVALRARMVVTLQVNGQRFQQGRLLLHYLPQATFLSYRAQTANSYLQLKTQQPRADLDVARETEVSLEIPYVSATNYYDLMTDQGEWGTFYVTVYSPLKSPSGDTTVSCTIWCHLEDVEIMYPSVVNPAAAVSTVGPQSGRRKLGMNRAVQGKDITKSELDSVKEGPISGFMHKVSEASKIVGEVPLLNSFAMPVSWVSDVLARSAKVFGFDKPTSETAGTKVVQSPFHGMNNYGTVDLSHKLAASAENKVQHMPGFAGNNIDEMSIAYLSQIPSYVKSKTWTTSDSAGTKLNSFLLGPCIWTGNYAIDQAVTVNDGTANQTLVIKPVFSYLAEYFMYWRGSLNLTIKIVSTEFHTGRLAVIFVPWAGGNPDTVNTYDKQSFCHRQILDIGVNTEFTVNLPYVHYQSYVKKGSHYGFVDIYVLNALRAPATAQQDVNLLYEFSAGPDFELAFPTFSKNAPVYPQAGRRKLWPQTGLVARSGGAVDSATVPTQPETFDDSKIKGLEIAPAKYCIGERILSLRQLLKRSSTWFSRPAGSWTLNKDVMVNPHQLHVGRQIVGAPYQATLGTCLDMINIFAPLYAYSRGSVRIKVILAPNEVTNSYITASLMHSDQVTSMEGIPVRSYTTAANQIMSNGDNVVGIFTGLSGGCELEIPQYFQSHVRLNTVAVNDVVGDDGGNFSAQGRVLLRSSTACSGATVYRNAGDDYELGFFIGVLPMRVGTTVPSLV